MCKKILPLFLVLLTLGCGFKPLYSKNEKILDYNINLIIKNDPENKYAGQDNQNLNFFLSERIHISGKKESSLKVIIALKRSSFSLGLSKDLTTSKQAVSYNANFVLYDKKGTLSNGQVRQSSSFDLGDNSYTNLIAEETTNRNLLKSIANEISSLVLTLPTTRKIYP